MDARQTGCDYATTRGDQKEISNGDGGGVLRRFFFFYGGISFGYFDMQPFHFTPKGARMNTHKSGLGGTVSIVLAQGPINKAFFHLMPAIFGV